MWKAALFHFLVLGVVVSHRGAHGSPCDPSPCSVNGQCQVCASPDGCIASSTSPGQYYRCDCSAGFAGLHCKAPDPCPGDCKVGSTCVPELPDDPDATILQYICICPPTLVGDKCQFTNPCITTPCANGGTCEAKDDGTYTCECTPEYADPNCLSSNPCATSNPCKHSATCVPIFDVTGNMTTSCICPPDYTGIHCQISLLKCRPNPCHNHATCIETPDSNFECKCLPGFVGRLCQNRCPCQNGGRCVYGQHGQLTCVCPGAYSGMNCQFSSAYKKSQIKKHTH